MEPEQIAAKLRTAFDNIALIPAADAAGAFMRAIVDDRTRNGQFLGGPFALKPYSEAPMPFSEATRRLRVSDDETFWITENGRPRRYLIGGYRRFRELKGRRVDKVELSFTGAMLNSLFTRVDPTSAGVDIVLTVPASQMRKAFHTHNKRQWLALSEQEADRVMAGLSEEIARRLR